MSIIPSGQLLSNKNHSYWVIEIRWMKGLRWVWGIADIRNHGMTNTRTRCTQVLLCFYLGLCYCLLSYSGSLSYKFSLFILCFPILIVIFQNILRSILRRKGKKYQAILLVAGNTNNRVVIILTFTWVKVKRQIFKCYFILQGVLYCQCTEYNNIRATELIF